jgi:dnd system-associated protein 4
MAGIWRDSQYTDLAKRLVEDQTIYCGQKIFSTYLELMIFAGMIGFHYQQKKTDIDKAFEIPQRVFENSEHDMDSYVYLCSLQDQKSAEIFRKENENDCWRIFECYANGGLEKINNWLLDSPGDIDGVETILNEMKTVAASMKSFEESPNPQEIDF